jgi:predicted lipid-binding transport protein (Tim44 family)
MFGSLKGDMSKRNAREQSSKPEDRPKAVEGGATPIPARPPKPAPMYGKPKSSGGLIKVVIGGLAGLFFGALLGGVSTFGMVFKAIRKVFLPRV